MEGGGLGDTIAAISTPIGEGGIGIVRLSGKASLKIADKIFLSRRGKRPSNLKTYTMHYGHIYDPRTRDDKSRIIDEVILTIMRAPRSYTKEDVVEINCHSGIAPLKKILDVVLINGARLACPGEFTKRAFLNGRIDIMQAEAVLDIIRSKTDLSLKAAMNSLQGVFSKKVHDLRNEILDILVSMEASIDFSEEADVEKRRTGNALAGLRRIERGMEKLILKAREGKILREGVRTVICGSPNVGKSSLMNALLKESRAIVTHVPGTTRDTIEETANIKGIPVVLVDTAGIRPSGHPAEKEGVKRSHASIQTADMILLVLDHNKRLRRDDLKIIDSIKGRDNIIIAVNKKDLKRNIDVGYIKMVFPESPLIYTCALDFSGVDKIESAVRKLIFKGRVPLVDMAGVSNERQLSALRKSLTDIKEAIGAMKAEVSMDCAVLYLRSAIEAIGGMTGHTITEEAMDRIFSEFCIGK